MPRKSPYAIVLSDVERKELERIANKNTSPYYIVVRAKAVLMAAQGVDNKTIGERLNLPRQIVSKWRKRFFQERFEGLTDRPRTGRPSVRFFPLMWLYRLKHWPVSYHSKRIFRCRVLVLMRLLWKLSSEESLHRLVDRLSGVGFMKMPSNPGNFVAGYFLKTHNLSRRLDVFWICIRGYGKEFPRNLTNSFSVLTKRPVSRPDVENMALSLQTKANA